MPRLLRRNRFLLLSHLLDALCVYVCGEAKQWEDWRGPEEARELVNLHEKREEVGGEREIFTRAGCLEALGGSEQL